MADSAPNMADSSLKGWDWALSLFVCQGIHKLINLLLFCASHYVRLTDLKIIRTTRYLLQEEGDLTLELEIGGAIKGRHHECLSH